MGAAEFNKYYSGVYSDRWEPLREALLSEVRHVALLNPHAPPAVPAAAGLREVPGLSGCLEAERNGAAPPPARARSGEPLPYYLMDGASVIAAKSLGTGPGQDVLDLCAAPGGKSLVFAYSMGDSGNLTSNDPSRARRARLMDVMKNYLPEQWRRNHLKVTGKDAARWGLSEKNAYDRVSADVPCSSERHLLHKPAELEKWSTARSRRLAARQQGILASGFETLKPGGRLLYSTCSISPKENQEVIRSFLKKRGNRAHMVGLEDERAEPLEFGSIILPDRSPWGPLYFCVIEKIQDFDAPSR